MKRNNKIFYWYKFDKKKNSYEWNTCVSYLRLLFILIGVVFCITNNILAAIIDCICLGIFYFAYAKQNNKLIVILNNENNLVKITGYRYSLYNPLTIYLRKVI